MLSHYDLTQMTGIANTARGAEVAGSRGYFLVGAGALLNQALISYAQEPDEARLDDAGTPFAMNKSLMRKVAQLSDYDETLYKVALGAIPTRSSPQFAARILCASADRLSTASQVTGAGEDQYLIATSPQPICGPRRRVAGAEGVCRSATPATRRASVGGGQSDGRRPARASSAFTSSRRSSTR